MRRVQWPTPRMQVPQAKTATDVLLLKRSCINSKTIQESLFLNRVVNGNMRFTHKTQIQYTCKYIHATHYPNGEASKISRSRNLILIILLSEKQRLKRQSSADRNRNRPKRFKPIALTANLS